MYTSLSLSEAWREQHWGEEGVIRTSASTELSCSWPWAPTPSSPWVVSHNNRTGRGRDFFLNDFHQLLNCTKRDATHFITGNASILVKAISKHFRKQWLIERENPFFGKTWPSHSSFWSGPGWETTLWHHTRLISWCRCLCSLNCECPRIAAATWERSSPQGLVIVPDKQGGWSQQLMAVFNCDKWWVYVPEWVAWLVRAWVIGQRQASLAAGIPCTS